MYELLALYLHFEVPLLIRSSSDIIFFYDKCVILFVYHDSRNIIKINKAQSVNMYTFFTLK